jgi:dolichol-phosphate mannosyltransferase
MRSPAPPRPIVLVPTYEERENLEPIVDAIGSAQPDFHVLVIDDASPDGTGEVADRLAAERSNVHVLHRRGKEGLGRAYLAGFAWVLAAEQNFSHAISMDADFSHDPAYLGPLVEACRAGADVAIGSRWVHGGGVRGWPLARRAMSRGGSLYARTVLGMPIRDLTAGFVCYSRRALETVPLSAIETRGYGFQIEMKWRCHRAGLRLVEVPIVFADRERGASKMSGGIFVEALGLVWKLRLSPDPPA